MAPLRVARRALLVVIPIVLAGGCVGGPERVRGGGEPDGGLAPPRAGGDADAAPAPTDDGAAAPDSPASIVGCADGEREGLIEADRFPAIAGCAGGWSVPGVIGALPSCGRGSGDDLDPLGAGCSVEDLCAPGWHLCASAREVEARLGKLGCGEAAGGAAGPLFFVTAQSGPGRGGCGDGANDLFGCGDLGRAASQGLCAPLDRTSDDRCAALGAPWSCPGGGAEEALDVVKDGPERGGALCCRGG